MSMLTITHSKDPAVVVGDWMTCVDGVWEHSWYDYILGAIDPLALEHGMWCVHSIIDRSEEGATFEVCLIFPPKEMLPIAAGDVQSSD